MQGGDIEFMSRRPVYDNFEAENYTLEDAKDFVYKNGYCRVPVKTGTLLVFSNYECVHRVLNMALPSEGSSELGFRDFMALFIVD